MEAIALNCTIDRAYATPIGSTFQKSGNFNHDKGFEPQP